MGPDAINSMTTNNIQGSLVPAQAASQENNLFPVFLRLDAMHVVLLGAGKIGTEKLGALLRNSDRCRVRVVAEQVSDEFRQLAQTRDGITIHQKRYEESDLDGIDLVISAVDEEEVNLLIREHAHARRLLVNVADQPEHCDFYLGSIVRKGHLKIAISTNGKSPTLAKRVKEILNAGIPDEFDDLLRSVNRLRTQLNGDFGEKVRQLNALTLSLLDDEKKPSYRTERFWKRIAYGCLFALAFLFIGNVLARFITVERVGEYLTVLYDSTPREFYLMLLTGFLAQLVDGALGMGYGVTCTTALLAIGVPLPAISGGIHTAEMFSSGASGFSHYKFGNVNRKLLLKLVFPAVIGAFAGAFILSTLGQKYSDYFKPLIAIYTMFLGLKILVSAFRKRRKKTRLKRVGWLGFFGGFLDSIGGGGWGPLVTSTLISKGKSPRYVVGTVSLTEFFVTLVSALTFFLMIGIAHWQVVIGLIIGGVVAAPIAARLSGKLPQKTAFIAIGLLIVIWSGNILLRMG